MDRKSRIYKYIESEITNEGLPPTIREIGRRFNISSTNGVRYFLNKLEEDGLIRRHNRTARGISIVHQGSERSRHYGDESESTGRLVPVLGRVPAGQPLFSEELIEGTILIDPKMARGEGIFAVKVNGDSMTGAGIQDGDIAVVKSNTSPNNGEMVVALIGDETTLKRFVRKGREVILKPENEDYQAISLSSQSGVPIRIMGTVLAIVRKY